MGTSGHCANSTVHCSDGGEKEGKLLVGKSIGLCVLPLASYLSGQLSQHMSCLWPGYKLA